MALILIEHGPATRQGIAGNTEAVRNGALTSLKPVLIEPIDPTAKDWVRKELTSGRTLALTNSYLFQIMKGTAQENQKLTEEKVLIPLITRTLKGLAQATPQPHARRLFAVPLLILTDNPGIELSQEIVEEARIIRATPMFSPRGHYTDSAELQRYSIAMQYLAKATIDVAVNKKLFPFPKQMLFPFETAAIIRDVFANPSNRGLVRQWRLIHSFYSDINGPPDLPTFVDLPRIAAGKKVTAQDIRKWAEKRGLPRINVERGLGIQPFGERGSLHEEVIDEFKDQFLKDDTPRSQMAEILRFTNLLQGHGSGTKPIKGLDDRIAMERGQTFYLAAARATRIGADGWKQNPMRKNLFASSMTSLAEQTALMAKTSMLVSKAAAVEKGIPDNLELYFEPDSARYLLALAKASETMAGICKKLSRRSPRDLGRDVKIRDISVAFRSFSKLSRDAKPLRTRGALWNEYGPVVWELERKPAVIVDVFQFKERSGPVHYYQWAIAPFEALYGKDESATAPKGLEMVFFEAWNDEIIPGHEGPVNNLQWQGRILDGGLDRLHSLVAVPKQNVSVHRDECKVSELRWGWLGGDASPHPSSPGEEPPQAR